MNKIVVGIFAAFAIVFLALQVHSPSPVGVSNQHQAIASMVASAPKVGQNPNASHAEAQVTPTLHSSFLALVSSKTPRHALDAYNVLAACVSARQEESTAEMEAPGLRSEATKQGLTAGTFRKMREHACGDLTEADLSSRLQLVEFAAEAGVPLAAIRLTAEGPWGDRSALTMRPDDPAVSEWRVRMLELTAKAARAGDVAAMQSLSHAYYAGGTGLAQSADPALALQWLVAMWEVKESEPVSRPAYVERSVAALARKLTPEQAESAIAEGRRIARTVATSRTASIHEQTE